MKIIIKVFTSLICLFLFACCIFSGCFGSCFTYSESHYKDVFYKRYDLDLTEAKLVYYNDSDVWMGEGEIFFVWQFEEEPTEVLNSKDFYTSEYATATYEEKAEYRKNIQERFEGLFPMGKTKLSDVPKQYRPDWDSDFLYVGSLSTNLLGVSYYYGIDTKLLMIWDAFM